MQKHTKDFPKKTHTKTPEKSVDKAHLSRRPDHEQPAKFPEGLKRPDLTATVDGNKIASEAQRQLFDDVKRGNCSRCHKGGHNRKDCKEPKAKWEDKFDKEQSQYWTSVLKWQQRAGEQSGTAKDTKPPTLHVKFEKKDTLEKRFTALAYDSSEDEYEPLVHYHTTMSDPDDTPETDNTRPINNDVDVNMTQPLLPPRMVAPTPEELATIFTDVTRQLDLHRVASAQVFDDNMNGATDTESNHTDSELLVMMDAHVRAILARASPRLLALNAALGHDPSFFLFGPPPAPLPLTESAMAEEIAEMYAYYHADTSSSEDESLYPYAGRPPLSEDVPPADPPRTQLSQLALKHTLMQDISDRRSPRTQPYVPTSTPHPDLSIRFEAIPRAMEGSHATPYEPPDTLETMVGSSSVEPPLPTVRPRASWMLDDGDDRTDAQADADWHRANNWLRAQPAPNLPQRIPPDRLRAPPTPPPPLPHIGLLPCAPWGDGSVAPSYMGGKRR